MSSASLRFGEISLCAVKNADWYPLLFVDGSLCETPELNSLGEVQGLCGHGAQILGGASPSLSGMGGVPCQQSLARPRLRPAQKILHLMPDSEDGGKRGDFLSRDLCRDLTNLHVKIFSCEAV